MTKNTAPPNSHDQDTWALNIGRFMMAFGQIEWGVNLILRTWIDDKKVEKRVVEQQLVDRITMVRAMAPLYDFGGSRNLKILLAQLDEIALLQSERNLLAHSPMSITVERPDPQVPHSLRVEIIIKSERSANKRMKLSELIAAVERVSSLSEVFNANCIEVARHNTDWSNTGRLHLAVLYPWKP